MSQRPVKIGMMSFAHMHAGSYASSINSRADTEMVGVADHDPDRTKAMAAQFNTKAFGSYAELLAEPGLDAVVVCSENIRHRELVEMAATAGKHILCEKPLATTVADAEAMIAVCKAAGVQLMTAFPCRYSAVMQRLKSTLESGSSGKILALRGTNRGRNPGGWFTEKALSGGGATIDHTVHVTDLMRWILNDEVSEVYCEMSNGISHADFDDVGFLTMSFRNGVFATWGDVTLEVLTTNGVFTMDMFSQNLVLYSDKASGNTSWLNWGSNADDGLVGAFAHAISNNLPVPISGEDGLKAAQVAIAAYASAASRLPVQISH